MRINAVLACTVFILTAAVDVSGRRPTGWGCQNSRHRLQVYHPRGLMVVQRSKLLKSLGVKMYVNKLASAGGPCDICGNTTVADPKSGLFAVYDRKAIVRPGDILDYFTVKQYTSGLVREYHCGFIRITESHIKFLPLSHRVVAGKTDLLTNNRAMLEETINDLAINCNNGTITNKIILNEPLDALTKPSASMLDRLTTLLPTVDWAHIIQNISFADGKHTFEVKSVVQKRKILRLVKQNDEVAKVVLDFDRLDTLLHDNAEDATEGQTE